MFHLSGQTWLIAQQEMVSTRGVAKVAGRESVPIAANSVTAVSVTGRRVLQAKDTAVLVKSITASLSGGLTIINTLSKTGKGENVCLQGKSD